MTFTFGVFSGVPEKVWAKLAVSPDRFYENTPCWEWLGGKANGYGYVHWPTRSKVIGVHRLMYQFAKGDVRGLTVDHRCENLVCANPDHLDGVSNAENIRRGHGNFNGLTACKYGHPYPENLYSPPGGPNKIQCRECKREWARSHAG